MISHIQISYLSVVSIVRYSEPREVFKRIDSPPPLHQRRLIAVIERNTCFASSLVTYLASYTRFLLSTIVKTTSPAQASWPFVGGCKNLLVSAPLLCFCRGRGMRDVNSMEGGARSFLWDLVWWRREDCSSNGFFLPALSPT